MASKVGNFLQVWEATDRGHIAALEPFQPYRNLADQWYELEVFNRRTEQIHWLTLSKMTVSPPDGLQWAYRLLKSLKTLPCQGRTICNTFPKLVGC